MKHRSWSTSLRGLPRAKAITLPLGENAGRRSSKPSDVSGRADCGSVGSTRKMRPVSEPASSTARGGRRSCVPSCSRPAASSSVVALGDRPLVLAVGAARPRTCRRPGRTPAAGSRRRSSAVDVAALLLGGQHRAGRVGRDHDVADRREPGLRRAASLASAADLPTRRLRRRRRSAAGVVAASAAASSSCPPPPPPVSSSAAVLLAAGGVAGRLLAGSPRRRRSEPSSAAGALVGQLLEEEVDGRALLGLVAAFGLLALDQLVGLRIAGCDDADHEAAASLIAVLASSKVMPTTLGTFLIVEPTAIVMLTFVSSLTFSLGLGVLLDHDAGAEVLGLLLLDLAELELGLAQGLGHAVLALGDLAQVGHLDLRLGLLVLPGEERADATPTRRSGTRSMTQRGSQALCTKVARTGWWAAARPTAWGVHLEAHVLRRADPALLGRDDRRTR